MKEIVKGVCARAHASFWFNKTLYRWGGDKEKINDGG